MRTLESLSRVLASYGRRGEDQCRARCVPRTCSERGIPSVRRTSSPPGCYSDGPVLGEEQAGGRGEERRARGEEGELFERRRVQERGAHLVEELCDRVDCTTQRVRGGQAEGGVQAWLAYPCRGSGGGGSSCPAIKSTSATPPPPRDQRDGPRTERALSSSKVKALVSLILRSRKKLPEGERARALVQSRPCPIQSPIPGAMSSLLRSSFSTSHLFRPCSNIDNNTLSTRQTYPAESRGVLNALGPRDRREGFYPLLCCQVEHCQRRRRSPSRSLSKISRRGPSFPPVLVEKEPSAERESPVCLHNSGGRTLPYSPRPRPIQLPGCCHLPVVPTKPSASAFWILLSASWSVPP